MPSLREVPDLFKILKPRLEKYHKATDNLSVICTFVGATRPTVMTWIKGEMEPKGLRLLRLWYFLKAAGYPAPELEALTPFNQYVSALLAYDIIDLKEVAGICGVTHIQDAMIAARGRMPMHPTWTPEELEEMYGEQLEKAKAALQEQLSTAPDEPSGKARAPSVPTKQSAAKRVTVQSAASMPLPAIGLPGGIEGNILTLATLLSAAAPLARYLNSDACSPEDRSRLRDIMGEGGVFDISNILNALCSERARTEMRGR